MLIHKIKRFIEFFSLLRVEPYLFVFGFFDAIKSVPLDQLIQDKICLQKYNLDPHYCSILPQMKPADDYLHKKSLVLGDVAQFTMYTTYAETIPTLVISLFIGSWIDKYKNGKKVLMIAGSISCICEALILIGSTYFFNSSVYFILLSSVTGALSGGMISSFTAIWAYISTTTPPKMRALRMTIFELVAFAAYPLGYFIGGKVLNTTPLFKDGQLHNYSMAFIIGGISYFIALLWIIFMINERKDILQFNLRFNKKTDLELNDIPEDGEQYDEQKTIDGAIDHKIDDKNKHPLKLLFSLDNVKDMVKTCLKKRDNYVRLQIWLLFLSMVCYLLSHVGPMIFLYPFAQNVYSWGSEKYSNVAALGNIVNALTTLIIIPILIKVIKTKDTVLCLIGLGAYFSQNMIRGLMLSEMGFYISIGVGALGPAAAVGIRTHFSKIVEHKELGKVFSLLSAIDSVIPFIASSIFTAVFTTTMDTMPGLCFIIIGGLLIIPFLVMMWIDIYTKIPNYHKNKSNDDENDGVFTVNT